MNRTEEYKRVEKVAAFLKEKIKTYCDKNGKEYFTPSFFVILGSGLGNYAESDSVKEMFCLDYADIPDFPVSTIQGHKGKFVFGEVGGKPVLLMQGRFHYYEGNSLENVVIGVRTASLLGIPKMIVTNAAGGVNTEFNPGDLMIIEDHISLFVPSPLIGKNTEFGTRFPDMSNAYSKAMIDKAESFAKENNINIKKGVYFQTSGPQYETPAEIKMIRTFGADAVGMSTACEVIAAKHAGMEVFGMSCITNMAAGIQKTELSHEEVQIMAKKAEKNFSKIVTHIILNG